MSLILDALNKADRERDPRDSVPDINTVHGGMAKPADHHRLLWIAAALGVATVLLAILVLALWLRQPPAPAVSAENTGAVTSAPQLTPAPAVGPASAVAPATDSGQPITLPAQAPVTPSGEVAAPLNVNPEIQALYQAQTDTVVRQVVEPEVRAAPQIVVPETPRQSSVDEALALKLWEESKKQSLPPPLQPKPAPAKKTAPPPPPLDPDLAAEETMAGYPKTPFLHELPVTVQDTIPTLMYARHDYEGRKVVINKTELRMGDATNGGVLVERVLADGVLLSFNGAEFKLASLSSWVNY